MNWNDITILDFLLWFLADNPSIFWYGFFILFALAAFTTLICRLAMKYLNITDDLPSKGPTPTNIQSQIILLISLPLIPVMLLSQWYLVIGLTIRLFIGAMKNLEFIALIFGIISSILGIVTFIQSRSKQQ